MIDKTPPYVTTFDQIKPGQTIEHEWSDGDLRYRAVGVAARLSDSGEVWSTEAGRIVAGANLAKNTLRVLAEPPKPALPTEPETVLAGKLDGQDCTITALKDGWFCAAKSGWYFTDDPTRITDWTVVYDPTAPKTDWQRWVDEAKRSDCGVEIDGIYIQTAERYWAGQSAPKNDDRLQERVENMAEDYRHSDTPHIPASEVFHRLRSILKERTTS